MAEVFLNPLFSGLNGRIGGIVFYSYDNKTYFRSYVRPRNPDSEAQRRNRGFFHDAMKAWRGLSSYDKALFTRRAKRLGMTGHNLFISRYMLSHTNNTGCEGPENTARQDIQGFYYVCSSLQNRGRSVIPSITRHNTPRTHPAPVLHPG